MPFPARLALLSFAFVLVTACGDRTPGGSDGDRDIAQDALPAPEATAGSITGMPDNPGPGQPAVAVTGAPPPSIQPGSESQFQLPNPETGQLPGSAETAVADAGGIPGEELAQEPRPQDAVAVIRDYYASINSGSFGRAYSLWGDGGRSSGQSPQQFADGFAGTAGVTVQIASPGGMEADAGSRSIIVPVAITATREDGSVRHYDGTYTLRRSVADGATPEQRAWRITSNDLRELQP